MMDYEDYIRTGALAKLQNNANTPTPYVQTKDVKNKLKDLFHADMLLGRIMGYLAAFGCFCAFLALCFFIGYFK